MGMAATALLDSVRTLGALSVYPLKSETLCGLTPASHLKHPEGRDGWLADEKGRD